MKDSIDVEVQESKPNIVCNTAFQVIKVYLPKVTNLVVKNVFKWIARLRCQLLYFGV